MTEKVYDYDKMGKDPNQKDAKENQLKRAPSADFNHQILKRKHISLPVRQRS